MRFPTMCLLGLVACLGCKREAKTGAIAADTTAHTAAQDTVAVALAKYNDAAYDTIMAANKEEALERGRAVYAWACAQCHGPKGKGDGGYVLNGDTLHPPSLVEPGWRFANDAPGLRKRIFVGNTRGMPHWGLRGMQPRDIKFVQEYILEELRKSSK
jgi:mono/diheme cytochrome c family protein